MLTTSKWVKAAALSAALMVGQGALATQPGEVVQEDPSAMAMTVDLLLVRPVMMLGTFTTSLLWAVSSPFAAAGGNLDQSTKTLVIDPAKATFVRCLGCVGDGYKRPQ